MDDDVLLEHAVELALKLAVCEGAIYFIDHALPKYPEYASQVFCNACKYGRIEIVQHLLDMQESIKLSLPKNWGLGYACENDFVPIVSLLLENGATDYNYGLINACKGGNYDMMRWMEDLGATFWTTAYMNVPYDNAQILYYIQGKYQGRLIYPTDTRRRRIVDDIDIVISYNVNMLMIMRKLLPPDLARHMMGLLAIDPWIVRQMT